MDLLKLYQDEDSAADTPSDHLSSDSPEISDALDEQPIPPRIGDDFQVQLPSLEIRSFHEHKTLDDSTFPSRLAFDIPETSISINGTKSENPRTWSDEEKKIFLLGLYIFGKNLAQVKRFMECKKMGEILSFYYGDFYRSDDHRRWAESRKMRTRRHVYGRRIFSGWRHNELLQRLDQNLSDASRCALFEATKALSECKVSFEEYVFSLKAAVGIEALNQAVGIGIENYDLTGLASDPSKTAHLVSFRPEIPTGKDCSTLTSSDIVKFLTGDFRLSKAKANDLFWEAVWPRLLDKGWHSEQPKDYVFAPPRQSLVFLTPAVRKFSRKLVKGRHYFDSITDVLNKVATDPRLLELEVEVNGKVNGEDNGSTPGQPHNHLYLVPHLPSFNSELMRFMVVDTSLVNVREMRSLPVDPLTLLTPASPLEALTESSDEGDEKPGDENESVGHVHGDVDPVKEGGVRLHAKDKSLKPNYLSPMPKPYRALTKSSEEGDEKGGEENETGAHTGGDIDLVKDGDVRLGIRGKSHKPNYLSPVPKNYKALTESSEEGDKKGGEENESEVHMVRDVDSVKDGDIQLRGRGKSRKTNYLSPVPKRQRLAPCKNPECIILALPSKNPDPPQPTKVNALTEVNDPVPAKESEAEGIKEEMQPELRALIDLNLPQFPPEFDSCDVDRSEALVSANQSELAESYPSVNAGRRQSTRNRPLTTKALEALASGFFVAGRKGSGKPSVKTKSPHRAALKSSLVSVKAESVNQEENPNSNPNPNPYPKPNLP